MAAAPPLGNSRARTVPRQPSRESSSPTLLIVSFPIFPETITAVAVSSLSPGTISSLASSGRAMDPTSRTDFHSMSRILSSPSTCSGVLARMCDISKSITTTGIWKSWTPFSTLCGIPFWTLKHLKVRYPCLTHQKFERLILGIGAVKDDDDGRASREENEPQGSTGAVARNTLTKKTITRILRSPTNAFLSNSLRHLELIVHPGACESILHWIGLSPRKHRRLQNLEEFRLYPHYHSRKHHHVDNFEVPIHLSLLLLFLRSWNGRKGGAVLKRVAIDFGDVFDDLEEEPTEKDNEEEPFIYVPRFRLRPSDLPPKRGAAQEPRRQSKRQKSDMVHGEIARHCSGILTLSLGQIRSKSALSKLLQRLPCLVALSIHCLDDPTFLKSIRTYAPELTTLQCKTRCSNFREQDWIDYFDLQKQKPRRSEAALGHPYCESCQISSHLNNRLQGLEFGPCVQTSVTDRVLLQIAFPKQASRFHTLDLTGSPGVSCTGVLAMLQNCPGLQTLGVRCGRLDGSMFQENQGPWICYKSLRELELSFIHFNEQGHASLNNESNTKAFRRHLYQLEKLED